MIHWWGVFWNSLWIVGLAIILAALSMAYYQAGREHVPLRRQLGGSGFLAPLSAGMVLGCLGMLLGSERWWEWGLWGLLTVYFIVWAVRQFVRTWQ